MKDPLNKAMKVTEAAVRRCFSEYMFLNIFQYSQVNTCVEFAL